MALCTSLSPTWLSTASRKASEKGWPWGRQDRSRVGTLPGAGKKGWCQRCIAAAVAPFPTAPRLTVKPPEDVKGGAAVGLGGQDVPEQPDAYAGGVGGLRLRDRQVGRRAGGPLKPSP